MTEPFTIQLLRNLPPGQRLRYYNGNFRVDIERSVEDNRHEYAKLLESVESEAIKLAANDRIKIWEVKGKKNLIAYYALGI